MVPFRSCFSLLTHRKTVLFLFIGMLCSVLTTYLIGVQEDGASLNRSPFMLIPLSPSRWFVFLFALSLTSLTLSTVEQMHRAYRTLFRAVVSPSSKRPLSDPKSVLIQARKLGYIRTYRSPHVCTLVKHPWGVWSIPLLHLGLVCILLASLLISYTTQRGRLFIREGEIVRPGEFLQKEEGPWAKSFRLPGSLRLDKLTLSRWPNGDLRDLTASLSVLGAANRNNTEPLILSRAKKLLLEGIRVYLGNAFGTTLYLLCTTADGTHHRESLLLSSQAQERAHFDSFRYPWLEGPLYARISSMDQNGRGPSLILKRQDLLGNKTSIALHPGEVSSLGGVSVQFLHYASWCELLFFASRGQFFLYLAFACLLGGTLLHYCAIPRVLTISKRDGRNFAHWSVKRFPLLYREERDTLFQEKNTPHEY